AERMRLLYVAFTRARDHLVVSVHRGEKHGEGTDANAVAERLRTVKGVEEASTERLEPVGSPSVTSIGIDVDPDTQREGERAWQSRRDALVRGHRALRATSATALAHEATAAEGDAAADVAVQRRGRGATSLGR